MQSEEPRAARWAKVLDQTRCIGCHACTTACKSENEVPVGVTRTYVKHVDVGRWPQARRAHQVTRCNQCANAPCVTACPTSAMFKRPDGIVDFDKSICIGCKACMAACPVEAILVGDMNDPDSRVAAYVGREALQVRRPEKETAPKVFYKGAHQATLDPLAARRPEGDLFMWSEQKRDAETVNSGSPSYANSSAAALLAYDVPHSLPWDWRVSLYTWTKGIAAGVYLVAALLLLFGSLEAQSVLWLWVTPVLSGAFLAITGGLLIWDLEHPARFYMIFTRPQWRSWLVRGGFIIAGYSIVLALHFLASFGWGPRLAQSWLLIPGVPLATLTAVYTAYLFAQAKARDLWQNPLLPPHLFVQALLLGSAALMAFVFWQGSSWEVTLLSWVLGATSLIHLLMVWGEVSLTHPTAHAALAVREMTRGRYAPFFWAGVVLTLAAVAAPWLGAAAVPLALVGLALHEHAYVQAGQAVPLA